MRAASLLFLCGGVAGVFPWHERQVIHRLVGSVSNLVRIPPPIYRLWGPQGPLAAQRGRGSRVLTVIYQYQQYLYYY